MLTGLLRRNTRGLRYEWRAQRLLDRGEIDRAITYADHYLPVASALFRSS